MFVPEAARQLGVTRYTVWRYIDSGLLEAERHGRDWAIPADALARFEKPRRGRPPGDKPPKPAP